MAHFLIKSFFENCGSVITVQPEQIHCSIQFHDLPLIPEFSFSLQSVHINCSLTTIRCIIASKNPTQQYIRQSVWKCINCLGSSYIVKKSGDKASCQKCLNECSELIGNRLTSTFCSVRVFEVNSFKRKLSIKPSVTSTIELKLWGE